MKALAIIGMILPWLGIAVRLFAASTASIVFWGVALWIVGAAIIGYLASRVSPQPLAVLGRILLWTIAPFVPLYVVTVLVTAALLKR